MKLKIESVDEFLERGGEIKHVNKGETGEIVSWKHQSREQRKRQAKRDFYLKCGLKAFQKPLTPLSACVGKDDTPTLLSGKSLSVKISQPGSDQ